MFLIEADGKKILHTGDFRLHGFRGGKVMPKILDAYVKNIDVLIIEGTTLSGGKHESIKEVELEQKLKEYIKAYKYVFVYCSSTNLERICAFSKSVPRGKYFLCDARQYILLDTIEKYWGKYSELYRNLKKTIYKEEKIENYKKRGFVMMVRDNQNFRKIIPNFEKEKSIMLYSMWDGYRTKENSTIPEFLELAGKWEHLHTSGHASISDIKKVIDKVKPKYIVTMHTEKPEALKELLKESELKSAIVNLNDKEVFEIK